MRGYIVLIQLLIVVNLLAQSVDVRERVYIHPNSQVLVAGETLRFSAYTLSHQTGKLSKLSKILYVQLVGENGPVFEQKVLLKEGRGSGEFFVNSLVPTGRYQLLAYTRWMRNYEDYFQLPVTIINPFETEPPEFYEDSITRISFYHPNGHLINGINAQVGFRVTGPEENAAIREGKIIDATGRVVQSFLPGDNGEGVFYFQPDTQEQYRVLLEDEAGNISFHEFIPVKETGYDLEVKRQTNSYEFIPRVVGRPGTELTLEIYFANMLWESRQVGVDEIQTLSFSSLPKEIFQVVLIESGEPVFSRSVIPQAVESPNRNISDLEAIYGSRDSLILGLDLQEGTYSISIHKKMHEVREKEIASGLSRIWSAISHPLESRSAVPNLNGELDLIVAISQFKSPEPFKDSVLLLPEVRNELVTAKLESTEGRPVNEVGVALAFSGKAPQIQTGFTNEKGEVLFHHQPQFHDQEAYLSVLDHETGWRFEVEEKFLTTFPPFDHSLVIFDSLAAIEIQQRSIDNQIVNAFQEHDNWKAENSKELMPQFTQWNFEYQLDDYERFPDFKEYFVEYILGAGIRNGGIHIRKEYYRPNFKNRQLVLLDGVPVSPKRILELDPYLVEKVRVLMNRVFLGPSAFDGVLLIETYEKDLAGYEPLATNQIAYQGVSPVSVGFSGLEIQSEKKPDRRINLYWNPVLDWKGGIFHIKSITSDVAGTFEIRIEGFTMNGDPVSVNREFEVRP